jgi:hypothetical protein
MGFSPIIGHTYQLYRKHDAKLVLSMVRPTEWGRTFPFEKHLAEVKLLSDHTWEIIESE